MTYPPPPGDPNSPVPFGSPAGPPPDPTLPYSGTPVSGQPGGEAYPGYGQPGGEPYPGYSQPASPYAAPEAPAAPAVGYGVPAVPTPDPYAAKGYAPQPGYPAYGYAPAPQTNGLAIASMVVSIVAAIGLCGYGLGGYLGILGAILGHVAKRRVKEKGESGEGMATAGIVIGWICTVIALLATIAIVVLIVWAANQEPSGGYGTTVD